PYQTSPSGIVPMNDNSMAGSNDKSGYVPQIATAGAQRSTMPQVVPQPQADSGAQMLNPGMGAMQQAVQQKYPNGILAGLNNPSLPKTAPIPTPSPMDDAAAAAMRAPLPGAAPVGAPAAGGLLSALGGLLGFAGGGAT